MWDLPEYSTKRRRKPIIRIAKSEFIDADESDLPDLDPEAPRIPLLIELRNEDKVPHQMMKRLPSLLRKPSKHGKQ
ncbi:hypothetical protein RHMOL_Rhmol03G0283100 [Rhododendron molle]|uniref:Uncharacterized protein n=1 Tax=Rhododendron molle TaxID=49168 RepID=A0ACC0PJN1_RHOML|nr:hypothetical protein RHMOL_Rhmol03G0283100 [Rhododendron molle]